MIATCTPPTQGPQHTLPFGTTVGVDVMQGLSQIPTFAVLDAEASEIDMDGLAVRVCSLEHLLSMKRASERAR